MFLHLFIRCNDGRKGNANLFSRIPYKIFNVKFLLFMNYIFYGIFYREHSDTVLVATPTPSIEGGILMFIEIYIGITFCSH